MDSYPDGASNDGENQGTIPTATLVVDSTPIASQIHPILGRVPRVRPVMSEDYENLDEEYGEAEAAPP
ncbi:unnamed protein product, partial [Heterosigma akashiwo]